MASKTPSNIVKKVYQQNVSTEDAVTRTMWRRSEAADTQETGSSWGKRAPGSASRPRRTNRESRLSEVSSGASSSASAGDEEVTPRHLIQKVLAVQETAQPVKRRKRVSNVVMGPPLSSGASIRAKRQRSSTAIDLEDVLCRDTPRTNIAGFLGQFAEETPVARKSSSGTDSHSTVHLSTFTVNEVGVPMLENRLLGMMDPSMPASGSRFRGKRGNLVFALPKVSPATPAQTDQTAKIAITSKHSTPRKDRTSTETDKEDTPSVSPVLNASDRPSEGDTSKDSAELGPPDTFSGSVTSDGNRRFSNRNVFRDILSDYRSEGHNMVDKNLVYDKNEDLASAQNQGVDEVENQDDVDAASEDIIGAGNEADAAAAGNEDAVDTEMQEQNHVVLMHKSQIQQTTAAADREQVTSIPDRSYRLQHSDRRRSSLDHSADSRRSSVTLSSQGSAGKKAASTAQRKLKESRLEEVHTPSGMTVSRRDDGFHTASSAGNRSSFDRKVSRAEDIQTLSNAEGEMSERDRNDSTHTPARSYQQRSEGRRSTAESLRRVRSLRQSQSAAEDVEMLSSEMMESKRDSVVHTSSANSQLGSTGNMMSSSSQRRLGRFRPPEAEVDVQTPSQVIPSTPTQHGARTPTQHSTHKSTQHSTYTPFQNSTHTPTQHSTHTPSGSNQMASSQSLQQLSTEKKSASQSKLSLAHSFSRSASAVHQGLSPGPQTQSTAGRRMPVTSTPASGRALRLSHGRISLTAHEEATVVASWSAKDNVSQGTSRTGDQSQGDGGNLPSLAPSPAVSSVGRLSRGVGNHEEIQSDVRSAGDATPADDAEEDDSGADVRSAGDAAPADDAEKDDYGASETSVMPNPHQGPYNEEGAEEEEEVDSSWEEGLSPLKTPRLPEKNQTLNTTVSLMGPSRGRVREETERVHKPRGPRGAGPARGSRRRKMGQGLPTSVVKATFSHFCQLRVSREAIEEVEKMSEQFWKNMAEDLEAYALHARRKTINESDFELLMRRQGFVTDTCSLNTLIAKYLPLELRQQLIPIARSGNRLEPKP